MVLERKEKINRTHIINAKAGTLKVCYWSSSRSLFLYSGEQCPRLREDPPLGISILSIETQTSTISWGSSRDSQHLLHRNRALPDSRGTLLRTNILVTAAKLEAGGGLCVRATAVVLSLPNPATL